MGVGLGNKVRGREHEEEITLYRSLGITAQNLICAFHVMTQAKADGIGINASTS